MMIPAKYVADFVNGHPFKPTDWGDDGLPIIRIAQLSGKEFDNYYDGVVSKRYQIANGDLLFSWSATIDSFLWGRGDSLLNQHIFKVIPKKGFSKNYLYYSLKHYSPIWADLDAHGSTMRHIKKESLGKKIFIPNYETQEEISKFLDREVALIDALIKKKELFSSAIEEKKLSLANQVLSGSILDHNSSGEQGWFGKLPSEWQTRRAKFLFREAQGRSETGDEELLTVSHITGVTKRSEKDVNMFMAESMEGYKLVAKSDVIINTMWAWMGAMGVSPHDGLISPSYGVYRPLKKYYEDEYLDLIIRSKAFIAEATRRSKGIHSSRLRLYPDAFLDILFPVPSLEEQTKILSEYKKTTSKENKLVELNTKSIELLKQFRTSLITEAVTGQLDIKAWKKKGGTDKRLDNIEEALAS